MQIRFYTLFSTLILSLLLACSPKTTPEVVEEVTEEAAVEPVVEEVIVGNDRDEHGCIGSAGYTWSQVRKECIRLWEVGIPLEKVDGTGDVVNLLTYAVKSVDEASVELFIGNESVHPILRKKGTFWSDQDGSYTLSVGENEQYELRNAEGILIYKSKQE